MVTAAGFRKMPLARVYLAAGFAATGLYFLLPWNSVGQWVLYDVVGVSSAVAVLVGTRRHRPALALAW